MPNNLITSLTTEILYMFNKMTRLWQSVCGNRRSLRNPETLLSWGFPGTAGAACFLWESNWGRGEDIAETLVDRLEFSDSELSLLLPWVSKPANQKVCWTTHRKIVQPKEGAQVSTEIIYCLNGLERLHFYAIFNEKKPFIFMS